MSIKSGWLSAKTKEGDLIFLSSRKDMDVINFLKDVKEKCAPDQQLVVSRILRKFTNTGWIEYDITNMSYLIEGRCDEIEEECIKLIGHEKAAQIKIIADKISPSELNLRLKIIVIYIMSVILYIAIFIIGLLVIFFLSRM